MRKFLFNAFDKISETVIAPCYKSWGKKLYLLGTRVQGIEASEDRLVPSLRRVTHNGKTPQLQQADFVAPNATVIGDVSIGEKSSIWYGATILGTLPIRIGSNTIIQDRAHLSRQVTVGNNVYVGPNAILQGSIINNRAFVGMGATVRHSTIQKEAVVAAGAVIADNITVPSGQVWAGNPAQYIRDVTSIQKQILRQYLEQSQSLARVHEQQTSKTFRQLLSQTTWNPLDVQTDIANAVDDLELPQDPEEDQFIQQRIFIKQKMQYQDPDARDYDPYQYQMSNLPDEYQVGVHKQPLQRVKAQLKQQVREKGPWRDAF